jgi:hypothetical protein
MFCTSEDVLRTNVLESTWKEQVEEHEGNAVKSVLTCDAI